MVETILAEQLVSSIFDATSAQVRARFTRRQGKEKLTELLEEYQMRANGIQSNVDLPAKMNSPHLVEELLAHCVLGDKTKEEAISIFVGECADQHARDFGEDLFDQMYQLISRTGTSESLSSQPGINRGVTTIEETLKEVKDLKQQIENGQLSSTQAQMALLQTVVSSLESGTLAVSDLPALIEECNCSPAGKYLESYLALCRNASRCAELPGNFSKQDTLIIPIVELAISTGNYEYALTTLDLTSFDSASLEVAIRNIFIAGTVPKESIQIAAPTTLDLSSFASLLNAEMAYSHKAYIAAESLFAELNQQMNPVARSHSAISVIASDALYGRDGLFSHVQEAIDESRDWMSDMLLQQLADALVMVYGLAGADWLESSLENAPVHLQEPFEKLEILLELSQADTFEESLVIMARAGQCRCISAYLEAAIKALTLDASRKRILAKEFHKNKDWLFVSPVAFAFYVKELAEIHSYQEFRELGAKISQTAEYHLLAYALFKETDQELATKHIELALAILPESMVNPLQAFPEIWVPYLVENSRGQDVIDIATPYLSRESVQTIQYFLAICRRADDSGVIFDQLMEALANSEVYDTRVPEFLARHFASINDVPTAGRLALKAFRLHETEISAAIVASWCITSSLELDDDVRNYIARTDTQMMNLVGADIAEAEGNPTLGDRLLIRAAFREGGKERRALAAYAARHAGNTDVKEYRAVEQDTCVTIEAGDGTVFPVFFFSENDSLLEPRVSGPAGRAFLTKTAAFISTRGRFVGEAVTIGDITGRIVGIESAEAGLTRQGFSFIAKDPRTRVISVEEGEDFLDQIADAMQPQSNRLENYLEGINVNEVTVYPGIETARRLGVPDKLEFTIEAIMSGDMPFRRYPFSHNLPIGDEDAYLLSYSAAVCLALLKPPADTLNSVTAKCSITESTARRLENECRAILDECFTSPGKLSLVDGRPTLFQNDEAVKQQWRGIVLNISELISALQKIVPATGVPTFEYAGILCDNAAIDIQTAIDNGLTYVTEDCLEAQMVDTAGSLSRCSLSALLIACHESRYLFCDYCATVQKWEAQPALEVDIIQALSDTIAQALVQTDPESLHEDEQPNTQNQS